MKRREVLIVEENGVAVARVLSDKVHREPLDVLGEQKALSKLAGQNVSDDEREIGQRVTILDLNE